jgi:seryl-tRNA synthetase
MIDIKLIREQPDLVKAGIAKKRGDLSLVDQVVSVDEQRRTLRQDTEAKQAEQNLASNEMAKATPEIRENLRGQLKELSNAIATQKDQLAALDAQYLVLMRQIPNIPAVEVPDGASDKENIVVRTEGVKPEFAFPVKDHEELALALDLIDMERGAKVAGSKFYYLKNEMVILEMAVLRFAMDMLKSKGFTAMTVPNMVRTEVMYGMGEFSAPEDEETGNVYKLAKDELYLVGTAEAGLVSYHSGEILAEAYLPTRYVGISPAYRREAGTYGKETRGLYRVHQFNKVEMVSLTRPEDSEKEHELLLSLSEDLLQKLGLHYQVVINCGGDLGTPQYKKWDIETWMPGMGKFGETHSCSSDTDYQARNLNIRYRKSGPDGDTHTEFVHTLNNTVFASPRILIPILENYQQEDGSIVIPEVLIPYTGFDRIGRR